MSGRLQCGTELSEVALAKELEVSRTPVHEALGRLVEEGMVQRSAKNKARVAQFDREDIAEFYQMRELLESASVEIAARRISEETLDELRRQIDALAASTDEVDWEARELRFDLHFHGVIAEATENRRLKRDVLRYHRLVRGLSVITGSLENLRRALSEHESILDAMQARDPDAARRAMAFHINSSLQTALRELDRSDGQ